MYWTMYGQQSPAIGLNSHRRVRGKTACFPDLGKPYTRTCTKPPPYSCNGLTFIPTATGCCVSALNMA